MIGMGYDVHQLAAGESLVLCGVTIPSDFGTIAHSDGDVVYHALVDALLGTIGAGDIGEHFPDTDPKWRGQSSDAFVKHAISLIHSAGCRLVNVDATLVLQAPKILPHKEQMKQNLSEVCGLPLSRVNIKATTAERMGFVGRGEGVQAWVVCEVQER